MTGTLILSRLVRDNVMKDMVTTGRILPASEGATLDLVTGLADDSATAAMTSKQPRKKYEY